MTEPTGVRRSRPKPPEPVTSLDDPRALQILSTEHWSLLSARSLAYNEAFTRAGMFLTFLSMSFVALALLAQTMPVGADLLVVAAIVLCFDLILGLTTYGRVISANLDDYRALQAMARIRHAYAQIAPQVMPFFSTSIHDDVAGVMASYHTGPSTAWGNIVYGFTTSAGMVGLIVSVLAGALTMVTAMLLGVPAQTAFFIAALAGAAVLMGLVLMTARFFAVRQSALKARFPGED